MFQVTVRIKKCRVAMLKLNGVHEHNSGVIINTMKKKMEIMQHQKARWPGIYRNISRKLSAAYRDEELYWEQRSKIQWLKDGDKNTKFFHVYTVQKRKKKCIKTLLSEKGQICRIDGEIQKKIEGFL